MHALLQSAVTAAFSVLVAYGIAFVWPPAPAYNPDPNHTHADFAVWIQDQRVNFARPEFMSGVSTDESTHPTEGLRKYLHLHDGNGNVIHRHKPGLTLAEFFASVGMEFTATCFRTGPDMQSCDGGVDGTFRMFVNGNELPPDPAYVFTDEDAILLTFDTDPAAIPAKLNALTGEACKYSKTCPWKGAPPTEGCIADPEVPCRL